ncbi:MAG: DUF1311 domain-containing protein [Nitrospirae bacterium]|nr:DUF1311 domain-containing protein [Nitrospirota bacterium]
MKKVFMYFFILLGAFVLIPCHNLMASCDKPSGNTEKEACLVDDLVGSDKAINQTYQEIMAQLTGEEKTKLRNEQRAWLKERDHTCKINSKEPDRKKWMQYILKDYKRTVCVVRYTYRRVNELDAMKARVESNSKEDIATPVSEKGIYDFSSTAHHNKGKWYFEVKLDMGAIASKADSVMFIGITDEVTNSGAMPYMRKKMKDLGITSIGIAADLDYGKVYVRNNGTWTNGNPGSSQGLDIKTGREATALITSSVALDEFLNQKLVTINFGKSPFEYALPDGYRPFEE